jgi:hypothetical protein
VFHHGASESFEMDGNHDCFSARLLNDVTGNAFATTVCTAALVGILAGLHDA